MTTIDERSPTTLEVDLDYLSAQMEFSEAEDDQVAFVGGVGCGKSMVAADLVLEMVSKYPHCNPYKSENPAISIFSNTYPQLIEGTMHTFFERCDKWGVAYVDKVKTQHRVYLPDFDAVIGVWSVDKPEHFKSLELCYAWIDEAQAWEKYDYDMLLGRLRGTATQRERYPDMPLRLRITANPPHTLDHWLVDLCTEVNPETGKPPIRLVTASTYDNPFLPAKYIANLRSSYDPEVAEIEMGGKFGEIGKGRIWRCFSRKLHLLDDEQAQRLGLPALRYDPTLPLCWSHDFNIDPMCSVLFQWRRVNVRGFQRDVMYVLDCINVLDSRVELVVKEFMENRPDALAVARRSGLILYGDASGKTQSNRQTGESDFAALVQGLEKAGLAGELRVNESNPSLVDRYAAGNRMLLNAENEVGVVIRKHPRADKYHGHNPLVQDCERQYYKPGSRVPEVAKIKDGKPVKHVGHTGDAWSYPIFYEYPVRHHLGSSSPTTAR